MTSGRGSGFGTVRHLARRFFTSLQPGGPSPADEAWAASWLLASERSLWRAMSGADRRHAVAVARRVADLVGPPLRDARGEPGLRPVMAAALLHDVGKIESGLGTWRRAAVTMAAVVAGRDRLARSRGRIGSYLRHDTTGAALLLAAGSDQLTIAWAREHHLGPSQWTVPHPVGSALKGADDD